MTSKFDGCYVGMQSDHGYNSMPKQLVRRSPDVTSPIAVPEVTKSKKE